MKEEEKKKLFSFTYFITEVRNTQTFFLYIQVGIRSLISYVIVRFMNLYFINTLSRLYARRTLKPLINIKSKRYL